MKIIKYTSLFFALLPLSAFAATAISLAPLSGEFREGQTFVVSVAVNPQSGAVYTVKTELVYPADLLEVHSFVFANNWMPLNQAGYDVIDNKNGLLIKTAGYPSGLSSQTVFGTATFKVKAKGSAAVKLGNNSLALDGSNTNTINNFSSQATFILIEKVVSTAPATVPVPKPKTVVESVASKTEQNLSEGSDAGQLAETKQEPQTAAVSGAASAFSSGIWLTAILILLSLIIGFLAGRKTGILGVYFSKR